MKKQISMTLAAIIFALSLTSCTGPGKGIGFPVGTKDTDGDDNTDSYFYQGEPDYDYKNTDEHKQLPSYYLDSFVIPWGEKHDLRMANGPIKNYFCYYTFNGDDEINNECLNNISTITVPRVRVFPADEKGYVVYEVQYTQIFPIRSLEYGYVSSSTYSYYGVRYVDFYTGTQLPYMNVYNNKKSGGVDVEFVYEGESYSYGFYQFKEQQEQDEGKESDDQGNTISKCTISVTRTDYIMVPENYDGLLMSVYVADWVTERQNDDNDNNDKPNRKPVQIHDPMPFDDEENLDDYVFFGISRSK